jgi:hypothetical protein
MNKLIVILVSICALVYGQTNTEPCTELDLNKDLMCWKLERCVDTILDKNTNTKYPVCDASDPVCTELDLNADLLCWKEARCVETVLDANTAKTYPVCEAPVDPIGCEVHGVAVHSGFVKENMVECTKYVCENGVLTTSEIPDCVVAVPCDSNTGEGCVDCEIVNADGVKSVLLHATKETFGCEYVKCWNGERIEGRYDTPECAHDPKTCGNDPNTPCKDCEVKVDANTGETAAVRHGEEKELRDCVFVVCENGVISDFKREGCVLDKPPVDPVDPRPVGECGTDANAPRVCAPCFYDWEGTRHEVAHAARVDVGECRWVKCWDSVISDGRYDDTAACRSDAADDVPPKRESVTVEVTFVSSDETKNRDELERLFRLILATGVDVTISDVKKNDDGSFTATIVIKQNAGDLETKDAERIRADAEAIAPHESNALQISAVGIVGPSNADTNPNDESSGSGLVVGITLVIAALSC